MARIDYGDWDQLTAAVQSAAPMILRDYVADTAKAILKKHIKTDIYDVYTPKENGWVDLNGRPETYQRRHVLESALTAVIKGDTMTVTSTAVPSKAVVHGWSFRNRQDGSFLQLLESGNMGVWHGGFARPAVRLTQEDFETNTRIAAAIRRGIRNVIEN